MENKFDKEIEDLGWEKMQALLNKEKPVIGIIPPQYSDQKSGKNGSLHKRWALAALLFLSLTGCGVWSYHFFKNKPETQKSIAIDSALKMEKNNTNLSEKGVNTEGVKYGLTKLSNSQNSNLNKQNKPNKLVNKSNLNENRKHIIDEKLTGGSSATNAKIAVNAVDKIENNVEKFDIKNAPVNAEKIEEKLLFEAIHPLDLEALSDSVSSISEKHHPIINLKENTRKMLQKWQLGLTLGAHTEGVTRMDGYQIGVVLNKKLTQKWAFSTGLNYRKASTKSRENASFLTAEKANSSASVTTPSSSFNLSKVVEVRLKNMKYLEMPIVFNHLVNNRLSVFGGLKMSYLLSKNWINIDTSNANLYIISYSDQSGKKSSSSANAYDISSSNSVNSSLDFAILGGINYRISRHFDVSVRYDFGLKNILNQNKASVYNRYLGLNVNYYFK